MAFVVTGATGHLGRLVVQSLLDRGIEPAQITAAGRRVDTIADLAQRGVRVTAADHDDPSSLEGLFAAGDRALLVSGGEVGQRVVQHQHVIDAAAAAGVELLAYTSILRGDGSSLLLAADHIATEAALRASGLPVAILRNAWYLENYTDQLATTLEHGAILGAAGQGRVSAATRADFAAAAATVLAEGGHGGAVHELGGDVAFTLAELAAEITAQSGTEVVYRDLPVADYASALEGFGIPAPAAAILADGDRGIAAGDLFTDSGDLSRLIGRPTTPPADAVAAALAHVRVG